MLEKLNRYANMQVLLLSVYNEHEIQCMRIPRDEISSINIVNENGNMLLDVEIKLVKTNLYDTNLLYNWKDIVGIDLVFYVVQTDSIYVLHGNLGYKCELYDNFIKINSTFEDNDKAIYLFNLLNMS